MTKIIEIFDDGYKYDEKNTLKKIKIIFKNRKDILNNTVGDEVTLSKKDFNTFCECVSLITLKTIIFDLTRISNSLKKELEENKNYTKEERDRIKGGMALIGSIIEDLIKNYDLSEIKKENLSR